jgi:hypothetical protein
MVDVLDEAGEVATRAAIDLEQGELAARQSTAQAASVVAFGNAVRVHASEEAFAGSPDSLLAPDAEPSEPPPHFAERGWPWPPRVAPESFMSYGAFASAGAAVADARMYGSVVSAERHSNAQTGEPFVVARTRTAGMELDLCLEAAADGSIPQPGQVIGGDVYLVASFEGFGGGELPRRSILGRLGLGKT